MVVVDVDHPDIESFIDWKVREEQKVAALVAGSRLAEVHLKAVMEACRDSRSGSRRARFDPKQNPALRDAVRGARKAMIPENYVQRIIHFRTPGLYQDRLPGVRHRLGFGSLHHRIGPEFQQHRAG